ncbi:MAG: AI-2E family transporter [Stellaceae bacterium]
MRPGAIVTLVVAVVALYLARAIFVPFALAVLLSFALAPPIVLLRRWHFGRVPSVLVAVLLAFLVILGIASLIGSQVAHLAENLPQYQTNIMQKLQSLRSSTSESGIVGRATEALRDFTNEISSALPVISGKPSAEPTPAQPANPSQPPIPVEIHKSAPSALDMVQTVIGPLLEPLATAGVVVIFVFFFLLQREDLRDRFIRLAGGHDLQRTTRALDDATHRLSRYLLAQTGINATFGILIGVGLDVIGLPNPVLWGILGMCLRFVPYIGAPIAALFPAVIAIAVDPGWSSLFWTLGLFIVVEPIMGQIVEPLIYGHSTGLSAVAVVVSAVFWAWLWGPVGLLLSTPLTVCLVVLGRHAEHMQFLNVLFGDQPALAPEESFYQRILAGDPDEVAHQAEQYLKTAGLSAYYDEVAIKGLALAQFDVNRGALDHSRRVQIKEAVETVVDDLSEHGDLPPAQADGKTGPGRALVRPENLKIAAPRLVLCVAGRGSLDEAAASMLAQLLEKRGIDARVVPSEAVSAATITQLDAPGVELACLSYLEAGGFTNARYLIRRLRRRLPGARIVAGFWTLSEEDARSQDALGETSADFVASSLRQAIEWTAATLSETGRVGLAAEPESQAL